MSDPDVAAEAQRWLRFAREDLHVVELMLAEDPPVARHACLHSQQAAEKALKAALVLEGIDFPFVHDLDALRNLVPGEWSVDIPPVVLARLTEWGMEARYPGDWPEPTADDAARAESEARAVYEAVAAEFSRRGLGRGEGRR